MSNKYSDQIMSRMPLLTLVVFLLITSCSDGDKEPESRPEINIINFYANGDELILQDIKAYDYFNSRNEAIGVVYVGFVDKQHLISNNSVSLYISKNLTLDHVDFIYSEERTNWGTSYRHFDIENHSSTFSYDIMQNEKVLEGRFAGELYSGLPNDVIVVDSCLFRLHR